MVNSQTQQTMYKAVIWTVCLILGGIFLFLFAAALRFGDGEAVKIIDAVQPLALQLLGAMVTIVLGSHATAAYMAKQNAQVSIATATTVPASNAPAASATATVGDSAAQQPASGV